MTLRGLPLAAGFWLAATAAAAAPQSAPQMQLGAATIAPQGFLRFCATEPQACAPRTSAETVRREAAQLLTEAARVANPETGFVNWTAALTVSRAGAASPSAPRRPIDWVAALSKVSAPDADLRAQMPLASGIAAPAVSPELTPLLKRVNAKVNRAIRRQMDAPSVGFGDQWNLPLVTGERAGDCEDYVLEKRRMLLEAGVPEESMTIAVVTTRQGETHAVLVVATAAGDMVLDNLTPWIVRWDQAGYTWQMRQVAGAPLEWRRVAS